MNILKYECRKYLPSSLAWAISLTFFGILCIQLFVTFTKDMNFLETMLAAYSPEMLKAFGAQLSTIKSLPGFYSFCFMYVVLAASFHAMYLGIQVVGKEISGKTADFLYTKPVSRTHILSMKLCSVTLCLILVNIIYSIGTLWSANMTGISFDTSMFLTINLSMFLTQCLFLSLAFFLACVMKKIKTPLSLTTGIVCSFFLLQMVVNLEPDGILSYISFLSYVSADSIMSSGGFNMIKFALLVGLSVAFIAMGYRSFLQRDIPSV